MVMADDSKDLERARELLEKAAHAFFDAEVFAEHIKEACDIVHRYHAHEGRMGSVTWQRLYVAAGSLRQARDHFFRAL